MKPRKIDLKRTCFSGKSFGEQFGLLAVPEGIGDEDVSHAPMLETELYAGHFERA